MEKELIWFVQYSQRNRPKCACFRLVLKTDQKQPILDVFSGCIARIELITFLLRQTSQDTSLEYPHAYIWRKYFFHVFRASRNLKWREPDLNDGILKRNFNDILFRSKILGKNISLNVFIKNQILNNPTGLRLGLWLRVCQKEVLIYKVFGHFCLPVDGFWVWKTCFITSQNILITFVLDLVMYLTTYSFETFPWVVSLGWVVEKSDFNENSDVSLDCDFYSGFVNSMIRLKIA